MPTWLKRLPLDMPHRGQRLAGLAQEVLQQPDAATRSRILEEQQSMCNLCGAYIEAATCELDHIVPVHQAFEGQAQALQALCLECQRGKTVLQTTHPTSLESFFSPSPPLVVEVHRPGKGRPYTGIDIVRCRTNGLANARFPLPICCALDCVKPADEGHLAELTYVKLKLDERSSTYSRLSYVGGGWYAKPATALMLVPAWPPGKKHSLDATAHVRGESWRTRGRSSSELLKVDE